METKDVELDEIESIIHLAASSAHIIRSHRQESGLAKSSSAESATLLPKNVPASARNAQRSLLESAVKLEQLSTEPSEFLERQAVHVSNTRERAP